MSAFPKLVCNLQIMAIVNAESMVALSSSAFMKSAELPVKGQRT